MGTVGGRGVHLGFDWTAKTRSQGPGNERVKGKGRNTLLKSVILLHAIYIEILLIEEEMSNCQVFKGGKLLLLLHYMMYLTGMYTESVQYTASFPMNVNVLSSGKT